MLCPSVPYTTQSQQHCVEMTTSSFRHFLLLVFIPRSHSSGFLLPLTSVFSSPSLAPPLKTCNCWCSLGLVLGSGWFIQHLWRICNREAFTMTTSASWPHIYGHLRILFSNPSPTSSTANVSRSYRLVFLCVSHLPFPVPWSKTYSWSLSPCA